MEQSQSKDILIRKVSDRRSSSEFLNLNVVNTETLEVTAEPSVIGWDGILTATLSSTNQKPLFAIPSITIYKGSEADANIIPGGSGLEAPLEFLVFHWNDFRASDDYTQVFKVQIAKGGIFDPVTIIFKVSWRSLFEEVTQTLSFEEVI